MPLLLTSPPVAEPVALADVKAHLRLTISDDDAYIASLITAARRSLESRYGLCLMRQSWALFSDTWPGDNVFYIPLWPVISVDGLSSFADDDTPTLIDAASYVLDAASRPPRVSLRQGRVFAQPARRINGLKLSFTAGFGVDASFVPQEIKQAIMGIVADWYQNRGDEAGNAWPAVALEAMAAYRNARLA